MSADQGWRLNEDELRAWLDQLLESGMSVVAPVADNDLRLFRPVSAAGEICLEPGKTRWSPKEYLFPRTETLYSFTTEGGNVRVENPPLDDQQQVLFGVRGCDAAGLARLDAVFLSGQVDPFYAHRRARTMVVTMACPSAEPECFCTAVGLSPASEEGGDVMVVLLGDAVLVRPTSESGRTLVAAAAEGWSEATEKDWDAAASQRQAVEEEIAALPINAELALEGTFDDPMWQGLGERCLSCSVCAYVCPSCTCFDVDQDSDVWGGVQLRCWDSCTFDHFTHHASGHNPRADQGARYRQRLLHKFAYRDGDAEPVVRCVGCGRCIVMCPAGIDIHHAVRDAAAIAGEEGRDANG
jgi:Fe-S-cluster-containing hydrogenase component 2